MKVDGIEADYEQLAVALDGSRIWRGDKCFVHTVYVVSHAEGLIGAAVSEEAAQRILNTFTERYGNNYGRPRIEELGIYE